MGCKPGFLRFEICELFKQQANPFGQPFLFQIEDDETLDDVKPRIQVIPHLSSS